jgi:hypothetical protein
MNKGDKVTGVPYLESLRETHPTVTGYYDFEEWEAVGGKMVKTEFVVVGEDTVDCINIRPAGRREKETEPLS